MTKKNPNEASSIVTLDLMQIQIPDGVDYMLLAMKGGDISFHYRDERDGGREKQQFVSFGDMCAAFTGHEADSGWIVPGVFRHGGGVHGDWYMYFVPPQRLPFNLYGLDRPLTIPIPPLVFAGVGLSYFVWALKEPLDLHMPGQAFDGVRLCAAPFPNVSANGQICFGGNEVPRAEVSQAGAVWEIFRQSIFNDHSVQGKSRKFKDNIQDMWRLLDKRHARQYPVDDLVEGFTCLGSAVEQLMGVKEAHFQLDADDTGMDEDEEEEDEQNE